MMDKELEKAAEAWCLDQSKNDCDLAFVETSAFVADGREAFKAGAEWQRDKTAREVMKQIDELIEKMRKKEAKNDGISK